MFVLYGILNYKSDCDETLMGYSAYAREVFGPKNSINVYNIYLFNNISFYFKCNYNAFHVWGRYI